MWSWWYLQFGPQDIYPFRYLLDISIFYHILNSCRSPLPFFFEFPSGALAPPWKKWWCHRPASKCGGFFMAFTARSTVPVNISPRLVTDHYLETKPSSRSRHIYLYPSKYSPYTGSWSSTLPVEWRTFADWLIERWVDPFSENRMSSVRYCLVGLPAMESTWIP